MSQSGPIRHGIPAAQLLHHVQGHDQFKRADCMMRRSAREIHLHDLPLSLPFYRFKITESGKSNQHELLRSLDEGDSCLVFYAAPRFHELAEIDQAWNNNLVATRSIFVAPSHIGSLDSESHHVAYDEQGAWLCSDPQPISFSSSSALVEKLRSHLNKDKRPLREKIHELVTQIESAERRVAERAGEERAAQFLVEPLTRPAIPTVPSIPIRPSRTLSEPEAQLRKISDIAARVFDTQLIIVQSA